MCSLNEFETVPNKYHANSLIATIASKLDRNRETLRVGRAFERFQVRRGTGTHALVASLMLIMLFVVAPLSYALKILVEGGRDQDLIDHLEEAQEELPVNPPGGSSSSTATIRGSVFYNDQRTYGLFSARQDMDTKKAGDQCEAAGKRPDCVDILKRLIELRTDRDDKLETLEQLQGHQGAGFEIVKEQLATLEAQAAAEEQKRAVCQARCGLNWLAGKYMVVDVIERDEGFLPTDNNCHKEDHLTSATVNYDGSFTATFSTNDACSRDRLSQSAIALRVRLRFCNSSYCFSINESKNDPYTVTHPGASTANPMTVKAGDDITMTPLTFRTAIDPLEPDNHSIAANYYASIVDTIMTLHKDSTIPFYTEEFGEIQYIFPSTKSLTATARSPTEVAISNYHSQPKELGGRFAWVDGKTPAHEYGHIIMQRAWDGAYGYKGIGITAEDHERAPAPSAQIAFKEAWAEFITRVVFKSTRGCDRTGFDKNGEIVIDCSAISQRLAELRPALQGQRDAVEAMQGHQGPGFDLATDKLKSLEAQVAAEEKSLADCRAHGTAVDYRNSETDPNGDTDQNLKGPLGEGAQWRDNIVKALCDWYDAADDNDRNLAGLGDHFNAEDIHSMWFNLRQMYVDADKYGGKFKNPGLWFCDFVRYYLDVRKSESAVGQTSHADYENSIRDLIYNNNIGCFMDAPK